MPRTAAGLTGALILCACASTPPAPTANLQEARHAIAVAAAWLLGLAMIAMRVRQRRWLLSAAAITMVLLLPLLPQFAYNVRWFGRWTPLVAQDL